LIIFPSFSCDFIWWKRIIVDDKTRIKRKLKKIVNFLLIERFLKRCGREEECSHVLLI